MRVALTGGMGAGKSAAAAYLSERGYPVVDADALARAVVTPGSAGLAAVVAGFGQQVLDADGALDRAALGQLVFSDHSARQRLEAIVHPLIRAESARLSEAARLAGARALILDIPLLVETGQAQDFDLVVTVSAPEPVRLRRALERGLALPQAKERLATQVSDADREAVADIVLKGAGSVSDLRAQIDELVLPVLPAAVPPETGLAVPR
jgi:dephospho-CoA kinase